MSAVRLPVSCASHLSDRVQDLATGEVVPDGIELRLFTTSPAQAFRRLLRGEFDVGEMSLATHIINVSRGVEEHVAIPVFPSRTFRHGAIYVRAGGSVQQPSDLVGRRVGVPEYQMTAALWTRGMLQHEYGVRPQDIHWVTGGLQDTRRRSLIEVEVPGVEVVREQQRSLDELLRAGDLDAVIAPQAPQAFLDGEAVQLFGDSAAVEREYYRTTGLFPIMHTVVIRRELLQEHPWVAVSLFDAFEQAKANALQRLQAREPLPVSLPWLQQEIDATRALMGPDFWPYGLQANRAELRAACSYAHEQGLTERLVTPDELFAGTTLDREGIRVL